MHAPSLKARPRLCALEPRLAPAVIQWDGGPTGTGTDWLTAVNWAGDVLPGTADDAVIGAAFAGVTVAVNNSVSVKSVTSDAAIQVNAGTFKLAAASSMTAFTLGGGELSGNGNLSISKSLSWTGGSLRSGGKVTLASTATGDVQVAEQNGRYLYRVLESAGPVTVSGGGQLRLFGGTLRTLSGGSLTAVGETDFTFANGTIDNQGTFTRSGAGTTSLTSVALTNSGTVTVPRGQVPIERRRLVLRAGHRVGQRGHRILRRHFRRQDRRQPHRPGRDR